MKVLIVNQHIEDVVGGSEMQCDIIASYLTKLGNDVVYGIANARREFYDLSYDYITINRPFPIQFAKALKRVRPDVVYWRYGKHHLLAAAMLTRYYRTAFVFGVSAFTETERWMLNSTKPFTLKHVPKQNGFQFAKTLLRAIIHPLRSAFDYNGFYFVDAVVCLNSDLMDKVPVKKQVKIYNSVLSDYKPFEWYKPYIVWVSSIKPKKNPEKYIELAGNFQEKNIDFLMIGPIQSSLYNYVMDKSRLPSNLHYLGVRTPEEVNGIIKSSLFLVHTCDPEGFGNNFIQAWLQEKPTISLYFDPEGIIEKHKIGFVSGSIEKMVEDVERLIADEAMRKSMGEKAKEFAVKKFSPEINVRKLEDLLLSTTKLR